MRNDVSPSSRQSRVTKDGKLMSGGNSIRDINTCHHSERAAEEKDEEDTNTIKRTGSSSTIQRRKKTQ